MVLKFATQAEQQAADLFGGRLQNKQCMGGAHLVVRKTAQAVHESSVIKLYTTHA